MNDSTLPPTRATDNIVALRPTAADVARTLVTITPQLRAFARRRGIKDAADIEDLVQDTFVAVARALQSTEIRSAEAYIRTTFARCVIDHYRSKRPEVTGWTDRPNDDGSDAFQRAIDKHDRVRDNLAMQLDRAKCIERVLEKIETHHPLQGIALELAFQGVSGREMALALGKTATAANEFLSQTRKLFEELVRKHCEEEFNRRG